MCQPGARPADRARKLEAPFLLALSLLTERRTTRYRRSQVQLRCPVEVSIPLQTQRYSPTFLAATTAVKTKMSSRRSATPIQLTDERPMMLHPILRPGRYVLAFDGIVKVLFLVPAARHTTPTITRDECIPSAIYLRWRKRFYFTCISSSIVHLFALRSPTLSLMKLLILYSNFSGLRTTRTTAAINTNATYKLELPAKALCLRVFFTLSL